MTAGRKGQPYEPSSCPLCGSPAGFALGFQAQSSLAWKEVVLAKGSQTSGEVEKSRGWGVGSP